MLNNCVAIAPRMLAKHLCNAKFRISVGLGANVVSSSETAFATAVRTASDRGGRIAPSAIDHLYQRRHQDRREDAVQAHR